MNSKIIINGLHLSEESKNEIDRSLGKLMRHPETLRLRLDLHEVDLRKGRRHHTVRGLVERPGADIVATAESGNLFTAIHKIGDILERTLTEFTRSESKKRRHPHRIEFEADLPKVA